MATPIYDNDIKDRIRTMFEIMLQDNIKAREQMANGKYQKVKEVTRQLNSQEYFYEQAYDMAENELSKKEEQQQEYNIEEEFIIEDKEMAEVTEKPWEQASEKEFSETTEVVQQQKNNKRTKRYRRSSRNRKK